MARAKERICQLHINNPDHIFDIGLEAEAEQVAAELTRSGFSIRVETRYGMGEERRQLQQIEEGRRARPHPTLFIVIPASKDSVSEILSQTVGARGDVTCVFLHQPLTAMHLIGRDQHKCRLFSVSADQRKIGQLQAHQFEAVLPGGEGGVFYVQGRQNSYASSQRMLGLLGELGATSGVKVTGHRVYGDWSPASVRSAFEGWKDLGGQLDWIQAAGAQSDDMAIALSELLEAEGHPVPVIGVDGLDTGKKAVAHGVLAATVVQPLGVGHALRLFRDLHSGARGEDVIPESGNVVLAPASYPPLEELRARVAVAAELVPA